MSDDDFDGATGARLDALDITRRARAAYGTDGRPALPKTAGWPIFPFDTGGLRGRALDDPVLPEPARHGEAEEDCSTFAAPDEDFVWVGERWRVSMPPDPTSIPLLTLHTRAHLDFDQLTDELGAELGVLLVRGPRALGSIGGVGRVHVYKWGDGGAHLHVILAARPEGMIQLKGMFLSTWMYILPPLPTAQWQAMHVHVAARQHRAATEY